MLQPIAHPASSGTQFAMGPGFPLKFSNADVGYHAPAPMLGANNDEIYQGLLGLSRSEMDELKKVQII